MLRAAAHLADFVADPFDAYVVRPGFFFWQRGKRLNGVRCFGRMTAEVVDELFRAYDVDVHPAAEPHLSIADFRGITELDLPTADHFRHRLTERMPAFAARVRKRLILHPAGPVGIGIAGVRFQVPSLYGVRITTDRDAGLRWLGVARTEPVLGFVDAVTERLEGTMPARAALRAALERGHGTLAACARAMACSTRSLQRRLAEEGTTFRRERLRHQLAAAERLLADPSQALPIAAIAAQAGYATQQHFTTAFRAAFMTTPAAYRRARVAPGA